MGSCIEGLAMAGDARNQGDWQKWLLLNSLMILLHMHACVLRHIYKH